MRSRLKPAPISFFCRRTIESWGLAAPLPRRSRLWGWRPAVRDVARGKMLITPRTIATLIAKRRSMEAQLERLTPREKEVLRLMAEGYPSRSIAQELGIS